MKIAFITRSTLYESPGGDTIQVMQTVKHLKKSGTGADIFLTNSPIDYRAYDLFHFSNITRPSDILFHLSRIKKPFVVSPILIDYSEYDRQYRNGLGGLILKRLRRGSGEYIKTLSRWIKGNDSLQSKAYLWKGQQKSIREILKKAAALLPGSETEYQKLSELYNIEKKYAVVPNGVDPSLFHTNEPSAKNNNLVICAARIEGIKNQLNLIKALNNTGYTLMLIGSPAPNQRKYYEECKRIAAKNIFFYNHMPQEILTGYYNAAKVHALPSWFETCGLSSLEAAAMGCNIAITEKGYTRDYFGDDAFYCDPADPKSIYAAIDKAAQSVSPKQLQEKVLQNYTWQRAASITLETCKNII
ncbi:MAG: glycosyl transferase group 1 [Chitinophagaceae bacterium]|nr:glycosyl transferase group 1 [Chitinophagaceae bacterium]